MESKGLAMGNAGFHLNSCDLYAIFATNDQYVPMDRFRNNARATQCPIDPICIWLQVNLFGKIDLYFFA